MVSLAIKKFLIHIMSSKPLFSFLIESESIQSGPLSYMCSLQEFPIKCLLFCLYLSLHHNLF